MPAVHNHTQTHQYKLAHALRRIRFAWMWARSRETSESKPLSVSLWRTYFASNDDDCARLLMHFGIVWVNFFRADSVLVMCIHLLFSVFCAGPPIYRTNLQHSVHLILSVRFHTFTEPSIQIFKFQISNWNCLAEILFADSRQIPKIVCVWRFVSCCHQRTTYKIHSSTVWGDFFLSSFLACDFRRR